MIDFPGSPSLNQIFTSGSTAWKWDGVKWAASTIPPSSPISVSGSTTLPAVTSATVNVNNTTSAPITITLPIATVNDQTYKIKDAGGNAGTYPITIVATSATIDGWPNYQLMSNFMSVEVFWSTGFWGTR